MLNEWLELAATIIAEEGGIVDKYVGDSVMAVFGAPMADDAHALRAVRAALRLRDGTAVVERVRQQRGEPPFTIGVGVNTGAAVAGNMGSARRLNYTVLGASVNAANRLCAEAGAGDVLIGEATYREVAAYVIATPLPPRISKGFSVAVTPYLVTGLVEPAAEDRT
jgi:class 3 adenylate cyclase